MRKWISATLLVVVFVSCPIAPAAQKKNKKSNATANPSKTLVPGARVEKKVAMLTKEVTWLSSLEEAKRRAREEKKAIFWLHALGDLEGDT